MNISNYTSINNILADALLNVGDEENRLLTKGFYKRQVMNCLKEIAFDTNFLEVYGDYDMPTTLTMNIPANMYNIIDIFVYNRDGNCDHDDTIVCDDCVIGTPERIFYKKHYISKGNGYGYTARSHENNNQDPFIADPGTAQSLKWYNIQNGLIMLSQTCEDYDKVRIVANGIPVGDITNSDIIPEFARECIVLWVTEKACFALKSKDVKYRVLWSDTRTALYGRLSRRQESVYDECRYRLRKGDTKELDDFRVYLSKMLY